VVLIVVLSAAMAAVIGMAIFVACSRPLKWAHVETVDNKDALTTLPSLTL
jgi:ABC-type proline/glycine betaine transport system permease subunit